ncbi:hypothetical protein N198_08435 [Helicobacter pylori UM037]|uniref:Uncharacterized protein n=1 Tax=Helicobacter pylori UM037 TaxID=1321939 RepID=A0AB33Z6X6_HELPX|nr:hypothetical protein N198_08435 [Helicobacter pylori UM037]
MLNANNTLTTPKKTITKEEFRVIYANPITLILCLDTNALSFDF